MADTIEIAPRKDKAADVAKKITSDHVFEEIERRYKKEDGWIVMGEVTDPLTMRRADALALHTYQSRGLELNGFEVKVSRGDWLRELKDPSKSDVFAQFCHRWWLVTTEGVAKREEIPEPWGWVEVKPGEHRAWFIRKKAPRLVAREVTRMFFMTCLRGLEWRFQRPLTERIQAERQEAYEEGHDAAVRNMRITAPKDREAERLLNELKERVSAFERATGIVIQRRYEKIEHVGRAVEALMGMGQADHYLENQLESEIQRLQRGLEMVKSARSEIGKLVGHKGEEGAT